MAESCDAYIDPRSSPPFAKQKQIMWLSEIAYNQTIKFAFLHQAFVTETTWDPSVAHITFDTFEQLHPLSRMFLLIKTVSGGEYAGVEVLARNSKIVPSKGKQIMQSNFSLVWDCDEIS